MPNRYIIDSNVFIQAKNLEYRFDFCGGFWDWLRNAYKADRLYSCGKVYDEIKAGDPKKTCPARAWCDGTDAKFFLDDVGDADVMKHYAALQQWAANLNHYTPAALAEFAEPDNADPFVIAVAKKHGLVVVTHERESAEAKKKVPMPNAAAAINVQCMNIYDVLSAHAKTTFVYKP